MKKVTPKDMTILRHLRLNSRMNLTTMSKKTGIPVSTIHDRLKTKLDGVLYKNTCIIDYETIGYPIRAQVLLRAPIDNRDELKSYLYAHTSVNSLFRINSGWDLMFDMIFKSLGESERFLEQLELKFKISKMNVHYIIERYKEESFGVTVDGVMI